MIIRTEKNQHYTTIANFALNDKYLSLKAKGLWAFIMSKPDDWSINYRGLSSQLKEGKATILSALKELEEAQYLVRGVVRQENGQFSQADATLYESPCAENRSTENRCTDNRCTDNQRTKVNTEEVNTEEVKTSKKDEDNETDLQVEKLYRLYLKYFINTDYEKAIKRYKLTPKRKLKLKARLKDAGYQMIGAAILGFGKSQFHNRPDWRAELDSFICRSYEQVEKGARLHEESKSADSTKDPWANL